MVDMSKVEMARELLERLNGIGRQQSSIDAAKRNFRILEMMGR